MGRREWTHETYNNLTLTPLLCGCLFFQVGPNEAVSLVLMRDSTSSAVSFPSVSYAGNELHFKTAVAPIPVTTVKDVCTQGATTSPCGNSCAPKYTTTYRGKEYSISCGGSACDNDNDGPCWCDPYTTSASRKDNSWKTGCADKCPSASTTCTRGGGGGTGTVSFVSTFALSYVFLLP